MSHDPVALAGTLCRFPKSSDPLEFRKLLHNRIEAIPDTFQDLRNLIGSKSAEALQGKVPSKRPHLDARPGAARHPGSPSAARCSTTRGLLCVLRQTQQPLHGRPDGSRRPVSAPGAVGQRPAGVEGQAACRTAGPVRGMMGTGVHHARLQHASDRNHESPSLTRRNGTP